MSRKLILGFTPDLSKGCSLADPVDGEDSAPTEEVAIVTAPIESASETNSDGGFPKLFSR